MITENQNRLAEPTLLMDKSRLQEIYDLRVTAYEASPKSVYVNRERFPHGWSDALDPLDSTYHWIIEHHGKIVASARVAIVNHLQQTGEDFSGLPLPSTAPIAFWSRLVVHPYFRKTSASTSLDDARKKFVVSNKDISYSIVCTGAYREENLLKTGFQCAGEFMYNYDGMKILQKAFILQLSA
jgi:hypothetical protein